MIPMELISAYSAFATLGSRAAPQAKVRGTRMPFGGLSDPADIDDVVAYIATLK